MTRDLLGILGHEVRIALDGLHALDRARVHTGGWASPADHSGSFPQVPGSAAIAVTISPWVACT
jgi:hypothetical protein